MRNLLIIPLIFVLYSCGKVEPKPTEKKESEIKKAKTTQIKPKVTPPTKTVSLDTSEKALSKVIKPEISYGPSFYTKNTKIKPQKCNLPFLNNGGEIIPKDMLIHDYFKHNHEYHFAVSMEDKKFLLHAKRILKDKAKESDLKLAYKFAKYCKLKSNKKNSVSTTSTKIQRPTVKDRDIKNLKVLISQTQDGIKQRTNNIEKLTSKLTSNKRLQLADYPRYKLKRYRKQKSSKDPACTNRTSYHSHGSGRCYDTKKVKHSAYNRIMSKIYSIEKKIKAEQKYLKNKQNELREYQNQLARLN